MPDLFHTLQGHDLGFLKNLSDRWGIELNAPDAYTALPKLVSAILDKELLLEVFETLPSDTKTALDTLLENEGKMPRVAFSRQFGEVRSMGAAKRDRERPDLYPNSPAEVLWYRGIIGKAFLNFDPEPQEYVYIPDDLLDLIEPTAPPPSRTPLPGRPASPSECAHPYPVNERILDETCTLLAALRMDSDLSSVVRSQKIQIPVNVLKAFLISANLLGPDNLPMPKSTKVFLESNRGAALSKLAASWIDDRYFNELALLPKITLEGEWHNNPLQARKFILDQISQIPQGKWWSISAFIQSIHEESPDFQRPAGDYDSWFIRSKETGDYLRGFSSWHDVEGAMIRFIIVGPMYWLGFVELAAAGPGKSAAAFRISEWAEELWHNLPPEGLEKEKDPVKIFSDGHLILTNHSPRAIRYLIARFSEWEEKTSNQYHYLLTPESLQKAQTRGLTPSHLIRILKKQSSIQIPPNLLKAIERWKKFNVQSTIEPGILLEVSNPVILEELKKSKSKRYIKRVLTPTIAIINQGAEIKIRAALMELGYFTKFKLSNIDD